jgi:hypothetical protein
MKKIYSVFCALFFKISTNNVFAECDQLLADWVDAVNQNGTLGIWGWDVSFHQDDLTEKLDWHGA